MEPETNLTMNLDEMWEKQEDLKDMPEPAPGIIKLVELFKDYPLKAIKRGDDFNNILPYSAWMLVVDVQNMELCTLVFTLENLEQRIYSMGRGVESTGFGFQVCYFDPKGKLHNVDDVHKGAVAIAEEVRLAGAKFLYLG